MADVNLSEVVKVSNNTDLSFEIGGVNVPIGQILGEKLVASLMERITEEEFEVLYKYMHDQTWKKDYSGENVILNYTKKDNYYNTPSTPPTLATYAEKLLAEKMKERIQAKVEEITSSEEFLSKADQIAQEIVDYATEGYKKDMKARVYERLVANTVDAGMYYHGVDLKHLIYQCIDERIMR